MDFASSTSAVVASLGNVGLGFGMVGPAMTYDNLTDSTKLVLSLAMILGRLNVYTILVLLISAFWRA